jgi:hypothetical protein
MRMNSVYCVECLCGHHIESDADMLICPSCHRLVVIEWPAAPSDHVDLPGQNSREPFRCQPITVAALTMNTPDRPFFQTAHSQAKGIDPWEPISAASPTAAQHRTGDATREPQAEARHGFEIRPADLQQAMPARMGIEGEATTLNLSVTSEFTRTTVQSTYFFLSYYRV